MKVETFEDQEVIAEPLECSEEALSIIEATGLTGQLSLVKKQEIGTVQTIKRCPYRKMKKEERFVYKLLCPTTVNLESFSECPIPLRVLQIISHAKSLDFFKTFKIWYADAEIKDPILVAYETDQTWRTEYVPYILARWGEELDEWPVLTKKALIKWREKSKEIFSEISTKINTSLATIDNMSLQNAIDKNEPSYCW